MSNTDRECAHLTTKPQVVGLNFRAKKKKQVQNQLSSMGRIFNTLHRLDGTGKLSKNCVEKIPLKF